jgi:mRNA interferase RelE/StbE
MERDQRGAVILFEVYLSSRAESSLKKSPENIRKKIMAIIDSLERNYFPKGYDIKKMKGFEGTYRIRIGDYRLIYRVDFHEKRIFVISIFPRKKAYKR